ncbi:SRPBCC family protein [Micromonospora avicenniae]|uniref:SRPBCC family protein n=1 Tax=Micromonospora avicenniae TaxID=1198245 RepID=UPI00332918DE
MFEVGSRVRGQPPPPGVVFEALTEPDRDPARPRLRLLDDERAPRILRADCPHLVVWSSLWPRRPEAQIRFDLEPDGGGTQLRWTLLVAQPLPDASLLGHLRKRLNELINAELRYTFGQ